MSLLFALALFVSAGLLFWVQPLVAKTLLPLLGGTPAVWNTSMFFFQGVLLAGYSYVLLSTKLLGTRAQVLLHAGLLLAAAVLVTLAGVSPATSAAPPESGPALWLLWRLTLAVGLPLFVLSATAPLLQKWFSETRHRSAPDPYFLYAASNAGSLAALVGFPVLLEPNWTLRGQAAAWAVCYLALVLLIFACALVVLRSGAHFTTTDDGPRDVSGDKANGGEWVGDVSWARRATWVLLAFVPSSLVLGVTTYVTTDVAAVPLLWVIPLSLYLLSFVLVFARRQLLPWPLAARVLPGAAIVFALVYLSGATEPAWFLILIHLVFFFVAALVCHGRLADDRPPASKLSEFYLWLATGGVLGGLFNAIVAPLVFDSLMEYPLVVVLACLLCPPVRRRRRGLFGLKVFRESRAGEFAAPVDAEGEEVSQRPRASDLLVALGVGLLALFLSAVVPFLEMEPIERVALGVGAPLLLAYYFSLGRPLRFALALGAVMLASALLTEPAGDVLLTERNFYGRLRVVEDSSVPMRRLLHGSTLHGRQYLDERACEPLSYYHRTGPLGSIMEAFKSSGTARSVAVIGLGTGASAAYAGPGESWTFYEIDPAVARLARDANYFTYLSSCAAAPVRVELGDARLGLGSAPDGAYGLIVLDAFSSDAVPVHLLTREALRLYLSKLSEGGLLALHVSNRSLDLGSVAGGLAKDAGLAARVFHDTKYEPDIGKEPSRWVVLARRAEDLGALADDARWRPLEEGPGGFELWTDDFSDIVSVFKWN